MTKVLILIPAAGASSRMRGRDKLLEDVDGQPLLLHQVMLALATGATVLVTLSVAHPARRALLQDIDNKSLFTTILDGSPGMSVSMRAGAAHAQTHGDAGILVFPADMPEITLDDLHTVLAAFAQNPDSIQRATSRDGRAGHPVVFPRRLFPRLGQVTGDAGGKSLLEGERLCLIPLPEDHALTDLDTPEDWAAWRAKRAQQARS